MNTSLPLLKIPDYPQKGWEWLGVIDLHLDEGMQYGEYEDCEFCWQEQIRYVHIFRHKEWPREIRVGRICAENLTNDYQVEISEQRLRNRAKDGKNLLGGINGLSTRASHSCF